jgi:Tol biopolymer transport system component/DNA-binding winged helix-turn-helix (wHTH) protein
VPGSTQNARVMQFGVFEVDLQAGELRKSGVKIKLQEQPFQILALLLERPGQVITREELRQRLWPVDTFVDFDHSLNSAVKKLRQALSDDSDNPRFVETLPRRGYRLIVPVIGGAASFEQVVAENPPAIAQPRERSRYFWPALLGAVILTAGSLTLWRKALRTPRGVPRVLRFTQLTDDGQAKIGPMASDGSRVYFTETLPEKGSLIFQVSAKGGESVQLPVPLKQPQVLDLAREDSELLLANGEGSELSSLWTQPAAGGSPRQVGTVRAHDARFGADGTTIVYGNGHDVYSVSRDGSSARKLVSVDSVPFAFRFSPDGRLLRFTQFDRLIDSMAIMEVSSDGTGLHKMFGACCGSWTPDGRFFIFQNRINNRLDFWVLPETRSFLWRKREEKPIQLTAGPLNFEYPLLSPDGKSIYAIGESHRSELIRYDSQSGQFVPYLSGISADGLAFTQDGQWVTYTSYPEGTLWRSRMDGSERLQLTFLPLKAFLPRWSPDGKQIAFNGILLNTDSAWNVYVVSSEGGTPQPVQASKQAQMDVNWSPDGESLIFGTPDVPGQAIFRIDLSSKQVSTLPGSTGLYSPRWSPDGKYIAALTSGRPSKLMLFDFLRQEWTALGVEGAYMSWSRDGKYFYFQAWDDPGQHIGEHVRRFRLSDRKVENVTDLKNVGRLTTGAMTEWFGLAFDDSPLFARDISTTEIYALEMNWP